MVTEIRIVVIYNERACVLSGVSLSAGKFICTCIFTYTCKNSLTCPFKICMLYYICHSFKNVKGRSIGLDKNSRIGRSHKGHCVHLHIQGSDPQPECLFLGMSTPISDITSCFFIMNPKPIPKELLSLGSHSTLLEYIEQVCSFF